MKYKLTILFSALVVLGLVLTACGPKPEPAPAPAPEETEAPAATEAPVAEAVEPAKEIVFFNWSEYIDPEIYTLFEDETGIKVVEDNFSSNEEMLAKLQGGATGYALIVPSDYTVSIMKDEGMLAKLDHANIPNLGNLAEQFQNVPYDPGNEYCVPYQWGTTGIGYLDSEVDEPTSWAVFFDPDPTAPYYGRMTMLDDAREAFAAALVYLGYDINTTDEAQLEEAKELLIKAKAALAGYDSDIFEDLIASGENLMAHGWNGDFLVAQEENENVAYTIPQEGGVVWVDNVCIPISATPEQKAAGEMFIDFLLRPDIGAMLSDYNWYATPNAAAEANLDEEFLNDPAVYPPAEVLAKLQYIEPVGEAEAIYQRLWDEVKSAPTP
ncbi:MAG: spermidine/putrescine ABC transporter substrate-binding protein [Chloroflexi bacterium]|nr:spermidine/putrescine ABC transporter substrate-binding protein [Chloroflexota bacterium]